MKNKKLPKVSIVITCFNYGKFIDEAIQSVINQTFRDFEIILIDDCSLDNYTVGRVQQLKYSPLFKRGSNKVVILDHNVGIGKARNIAIEKSLGRYILCLDADDMIDKDCLAKMMLYIDKYDIVSCGFREFGSSSKTYIRQYSKYSMCLECLFPVTSLFKKEDWGRVGGFQEKIENEDYNFWLTLINHGALVKIIQQPLLFYRKHDNKNSRQDGVDRMSVNDRLQLQELKIITNPKLFNWFIEEQKKFIKTLRKKLSKCKIFLGTSILINFIQVIVLLLR